MAPGLSVVSKKYGLAGVLISYQGSAPLLGMDMNGSDYNDATYNSKVISFIKSHTELQTVFLTAWWSGYTDVNQGNTNMTDYIDTNFGQSKEKLFRKGLLRTINTLIELGRRVIIISDVPQIKSSAIHAYYISRRTGYIDSNIMPTIYEYQEKNSVIIDLLSRYKYNRNVFIIHPESVLLRLKGDKIIDGSFGPLYSDNNHLTPVGARFVSQVFDEAFNNISNGKWKNK